MLDFPAPIIFAHVPKKLRNNWRWLWLLDSRLAELTAREGEAILMQMRLGWWREQLASHAQARHAPDPLLSYLGNSLAHETLSLYGARLIDTHEALALGERTVPAMAERGMALAECYCALSGDDMSLGVKYAGTLWGLAQPPLHPHAAETLAQRAHETALVQSAYVKEKGHLPHALSLMAMTGAMLARNWPQPMRRRDALRLSLHGLTRF